MSLILILVLALDFVALLFCGLSYLKSTVALGFIIVELLALDKYLWTNELKEEMEKD